MRPKVISKDESIELILDKLKDFNVDNLVWILDMVDADGYFKAVNDEYILWEPLRNITKVSEKNTDK